jgi:hypothetical protein
MTSYLEQLEQDLVEAIERRRAPRTLLRRGLRLWPFAAAAAAALLIALVVAGHETGREEAVHPTPTAAPRPTPTTPGARFELRGRLTRVAAGAWRGEATGPGGPGTLTITGTVDLSRTRCCGSPQRPGSFSEHVVRFSWLTTIGKVEGCINNGIYRRPHGRWVWDGVGHVTTATGQLSRYRDRGATIAGRTLLTSPDAADIHIAAGNDPPPERCR